ncbi:unnamed protein product [Closterium sp. NIES-54]
MAFPRGFFTAATLALVALLAASLLPAAQARKDVLSSADDASSALPASSSADAAVSTAASAAAGGASGAEAIADMIQRQGPRILHVESYNADEPLPEHLKDMEVHRRELQWTPPLTDKELVQPKRPDLSAAAALALVALLAASLLPAAHARKDALSSADNASATTSALPAFASTDAAVSAVSAAAAGGASGAEAIADMIQRQGPRILNVESYNADEPFPEHLKYMETHRRELQWKPPLTDSE